MALGMPGLEQIFDLRVDGSRSRRISETPTEKTVEITIRRWQPPSPFPMGHGIGPHLASAVQPGYDASWQHLSAAWGAAQAAGSVPAMPRSNGQAWSHCPPGYGPAASPQPPQQAPAPVAANPVEAQMTSQLARLETALATLKPQIEAAVAVQSQAQSQSSHSKPPGPGSPSTGGISPKNCAQSPLGTRRLMKDIRIGTQTKSQSQPQQDSTLAAEPEVKQIQPAVGRDSQSSSTNQVESKDRNRPRPVTTGRMVPNAGDPESPRSPGRYSVWK